MLDYTSLIFYRHSVSAASSANTLPSPFHARSAFNAAIQDHPSRFSGPSAVNSASTAPATKTTASPSRARSAAAHPFTAIGRVSSDFSPSPYPTRFQNQFRACLLPIFAENQLRIGVSATPRNREIFRAGRHRVQSHLLFSPAVPPLSQAS